jgi:hypothetical protein
MADRIVGVVKFHQSVNFGGTEATTLGPGIKTCTSIKRVDGGIEAFGAKDPLGVFVPDANICFCKYAAPAEQQKAPGRV